MKAINRSKSGFDNKLLNKEVLRLQQDKKVKESWILGPDFCAVELTHNTLKAQAVAVTHWRDKHDEELGKNIALGRAYLRLAIQNLKENVRKDKEQRLVNPNNARRIRIAETEEELFGKHNDIITQSAQTSIRENA